MCKLEKIKKNGHTSIEYRTFKNFEESSFLYDLNEADFQSIVDIQDADEAFNTLSDLFCSIIDKHAPLRQHRVKHQTLPSWMTEDIINAMSLRDFYKQNNMKQDFKKQRNKVKNMQTKAKKKYFNSLLEDEKSVSTLWRAMNEILDKGRHQKNYCPTQISPESFKDHFITIAEKLAPPMAKSDDDQSRRAMEKLQTFCNDRLKPDVNFCIPYIAVYEVGRYIEGLDNKKAMGLDKIPVHLLKLALPYIVEPLTYVYNLCIENNTFPSALKMAKVIPLPKSNDRSDPNNFRPISILPILTKPLEKHIQSHMSKYLENNKLFHDFQSGFRKQHSCHTALTALCDTWLKSIQDSEINGAVFLDLKKAFDLVNHSILLEKLKLYFKNKSTIDFFASYLKDRKQIVSLNCHSSSAGVVNIGVPQGSILGPLLFCIYINDLPLCLGSETTRCDMFVDDSSLHVHGKSIESVRLLLQKSLDEVDVWCHVNRMVINPEKTKSMVITTRQKHQLKPLLLDLSIKETKIEQVQKHRVLGITIDQELKWESHISSLSKKLSRNLYLLSKLSRYAEQDALMMFYNAHIMSHINFASSLWDGAADVHFKKLDSLHRRAAKIILKGHQISTDEKQKMLNMLPLKKQMLYNKAIFMYKVFHNITPKIISSLFQKAPLRYNSLNFIVPPTRIDLVKTSFAFSGSTLWNSFSTLIKTSPCLSAFKRNLSNRLMTL